MARQEEVMRLIEQMDRNMPTAFFQSFDRTNAGIGCVLRLLYQTEEPVTAGEISENMHVSTARVAVLLHNMEQRQLISRARDPKDARRTMISLTRQGRERVQQAQDWYLHAMDALVDRIGYAGMEQFIRLSAEIKTVMTEEFPNCPMATNWTKQAK